MPKLYTKTLDHVTVKGFRSIKSIEKLELGWLNVLIGANGAGKSNFVGVFDFMRALRRGQLAHYTDKNGGADAMLHLGSKETSEIEIELSFQNETNGYLISLTPTDADDLSVRDESCWSWRKEEHAHPVQQQLTRAAGGEAGISREQTGAPRAIAYWIQQHLESWGVYHFHDTSASSPIKKTADVDDNRRLRPDGANLAAYLFALRDQEPERYEMIRDTIRRVAPFFQDFVLEPVRRNRAKIKLEWRHRSSERYFDAAALSDGTLRFMCMAALFLGPESSRPSLVLLDEPELGLHPFALTMLASMLISVAKTTQVIVATQSPILLDHFGPEDVLVAELTNGSTIIKPLDPRELAAWLEDYSLGQLWEKNQFGGRLGA